MFGGALMLISGVTLSRYAIGNIETRAEGVLLLAEQQLASALQASKPRLLQRQQIHQQAKRRQQELAATDNWQPALYALAEQLPEKAWFTKMAWQKIVLCSVGWRQILLRSLHWNRCCAVTLHFCLSIPGQHNRMLRGDGNLSTSYSGETTMNTFFDFWCATSPRLRLICWGLWVIALCGLSRIALSPPVENGRDAQSRLHQANLLQWRTLHKIAGSADEQRLVSDDNALPFSPFDFQQAEMQLVLWQPSAEGGELALKGPGQQYLLFSDNLRNGRCALRSLRSTRMRMDYV